MRINCPTGHRATIEGVRKMDTEKNVDTEIHAEEVTVEQNAPQESSSEGDSAGDDSGE